MYAFVIYLKCDAITIIYEVCSKSTLITIYQRFHGFIVKSENNSLTDYRETGLKLAI